MGAAMTKAGRIALAVTLIIPLHLTTALVGPSQAGSSADSGTSVEVERPAGPGPETSPGYKPRWADPNARPPMPGIDSEPTPFNPADVDTNSDPLSNNLNNVDQ